MSHPTVSVVIPTYNRSRFLPETIESVLSQTFKDYEIVVVDDGSTDDTPGALRPYMQDLRYFYKEHEGLCLTRNFGIDKARGRLIAFLDSDDLWLPQKLEAHVQLMSRSPILGWSYSDRMIIDEDGNVLQGKMGWNYPSGGIFRRLVSANYMLPSQVVVRKECFDVVGKFSEDPRATCVQDYDMWLRLAYRFGAGYIDLPLVKYRSHAGCKSKDVMGHYVGKRYALNHIWQLHGDEMPDLRRLIHKRLFDCHSEHGASFFYRGEYDQATDAFWAALKMRPWSIRSWIYWCASCLGNGGVDRVRRIKRRIWRTSRCSSAGLSDSGFDYNSG